MKLPSLKISLPVIAVLWCVLGSWLHGLVMLAYPAMWLAIGLLLVGLHVVLKSRAVPDSSKS